MTRFTTGRVAACGGALVLAIGAGYLVAPAANADTGLGLTRTLNGVVSGTGLTGSSSTPVVVPVVSTTVQNLAGSTGLTGASSTPVSSPVVTSVQNLTDSTGFTGSSSTPVVSPTVQDLTGSTSPTVTTTTPPAASSTVQRILDYLTTTTGTGSLTGSGTNSGSGGVTLAVGDDGRGGSIVSVNLGGQRSTTVGGTGSAGIDGADGGSNTGTGSAGADGAGGGSTSTTTTTSNSTDTGAGAGASSGLLGLQIRRSLATVYPVKDGYRDQVAFTLDGLTASGQPQAIAGLAVLKRGGAVVKRWPLTRSDQVLQWNGRSGSKVITGGYRLLVGLQDATGRGFGAATGTKVSAKRLVASTQRLQALSISGTHRMAAKPRAGLSRGTVTVRVTSVATKVEGGVQKLIFEKGGKRFAVRITKGTRTSRAITVPASFTSYRIKHTWKKGQVRLKSVKYTYSYQALK